MIKQGRLDKPYNGVLDCTKRVLATEGVYPFWRGNMANVLRYFPTQALNFAFKDTIKAAFKTSKDALHHQDQDHRSPREEVLRLDRRIHSRLSLHLPVDVDLQQEYDECGPSIV